MAISLYDASVRSFLQVVGSVEAFLDKGAKHLVEKGVDVNSIVETSLYPDMLPFRFQLASVAHHSLGAIAGVRAGLFGPPDAPPISDYAGLQALIKATREGLQALSADEINGYEGKDVLFKFGTFQVPFLAEGFLMSFSLPNVHFHATTAYDILRTQGVPLGKRDYMGAMRVKT